MKWTLIVTPLHTHEMGTMTEPLLHFLHDLNLISAKRPLKWLLCKVSLSWSKGANSLASHIGAIATIAQQAISLTLALSGITGRWLQHKLLIGRCQVHAYSSTPRFETPHERIKGGLLGFISCSTLFHFPFSLLLLKPMDHSYHHQTSMGAEPPMHHGHEGHDMPGMSMCSMNVSMKTR